MEIKELSRWDTMSLFPKRNPFSHKGDYGRILLLCGSQGYTGAAALAAKGALRSGAGLVFLGVPESIYAIEAVKLDEPVVFPLPDEDGMLSRLAIPRIRQKMESMDAVLIGPGLGQSSGTLEVLSLVLNEFKGPVVVDADGINLLAMHKDLLRGRTGTTILTPHVGEFKRFWGPICEDRIKVLAECAKEFHCIIALKDHETIITDGESCFVNHTGNPGMAVGGSGDVLAGVITSLLGQKVPALKAAAAGVWLHGAAGDLCAESIGEYGMLPSDLIEALPRLLK